MQNLSINYYDIASMILFGIGFTTLLLNRNLIKKVIGLNIMETSIFLFLTAKGYIVGGNVPIVNLSSPNVSYINPIPSGLVLTGIVVSVSVTAVSLALIIRIYKKFNTLDIDKIAKLKGDE